MPCNPVFFLVAIFTGIPWVINTGSLLSFTDREHTHTDTIIPPPSQIYTFMCTPPPQPTHTHTWACMCTHIFACTYTYHICCLSLLIVWWLQTVYTQCQWLHGLPNTTASFLIILMGTVSVSLFSVLNTGCCIVCAWSCSHLMCFVLRLQCKWDCNRDHWQSDCAFCLVQWNPSVNSIGNIQQKWT